MKLRLVVSVLSVLLVLTSNAFAADNVLSSSIREADGTTGQNTNAGAGIKTGHIQDLAVTNTKLADGSVTDSKITGPISSSKISSSGLNADLLDGQHAGSFASASHSHVDVDSRLAALELVVGVLQTDLALAHARISTLETAATAAQTTIVGLQTDLAQLQSNPILSVGQYLSVDLNPLNGLNGPHLLFTGVNLHLRNGVGTTDGLTNDVGNLVIGYDELPANFVDGERSGSHNLILGMGNRHSSFGGIVSGFENRISYDHAAVISGLRNSASGFASTIVGGEHNEAREQSASVVGGNYNKATSIRSSVFGGQGNTAMEVEATILGGEANYATGGGSTVCGGVGNNAEGFHSSISGGFGNWARGDGSSISGGYQNKIFVDGVYATLGGGTQRTVNGMFDWAAGDLWQDQ